MAYPRILHLTEIAPEADFHAALVTLTYRREDTAVHTHSFGEMMYVVSGHGLHEINGETETLTEGCLRLIRPHDIHAIRAVRGERLHFINIAYPVESWEVFLPVAGLEAAGRAWRQAAQPPGVLVPPQWRASTAEMFSQALRAFYQGSSRLALCRFWASVLPALAHRLEPQEDEAGPAWLTEACRAMQDTHNLRRGLPHMVALSGVSPAHLSRTLRAVRGQTPTEFITALRLDRAATLLATTPREIIEIASDCGFDNLSHFYRRFRAQYGLTPRAYRLRAYRSIAP